MPRSNLLTLQEAADYLAISVGYLRRLVREKRIPYVKVGKYVRFNIRDLDGWLDARRVDPLPR